MFSFACLPVILWAALFQPGLACWLRTPTPSPPPPSPNTRMTHTEARSMLSRNGIGISSSGGCSNRNQPNCTSLDTIRRKCIDDLIWFKKLSGCSSVVVTGGTETGHSSGTKSHWNGYKIDIRLNTCVNNYIQTRFTYIGLRSSDNARLYRDSRGNTYAKEGNHWDILYP